MVMVVVVDASDIEFIADIVVFDDVEVRSVLASV